MRCPNLEIYWDENAEVFFIWHCAVYKEWTRPTDNPQQVARATMQLSGIDLVLQSLQGYHQRPLTDPTGIYAGFAGRSFRLGHRGVVVDMPACDRLLLLPWQVYRSGAHVAGGEHVIPVPLPCEAKAFFDVLTTALSYSNTIDELVDAD